MAPEQKKNILDQAIDLISNRDEKAAAEEAKMKAAAEANAKAAAEANAKAVAAANAQAAADASAKAVADANAKVKAMEAQVAAEANAKATEARNADIKKMLDAQKAAEILTTHTVVAGETLSDIAMKYYKSSVREKWMKIYEANKTIIGENPGMIKAGQELKIPKA